MFEMFTFSLPVMLVKFMHSHLMLQAQGISDNLWQMYRPLAYRDQWSVIPMLLRPKSRGRVLLRSSNPYDKPIFHAGYFTHPEDIKVCDSSW